MRQRIGLFPGREFRCLELRWKTDGELDGGVLGMDFARACANDERRFFPGLATKPLWQIVGAQQSEQRDQRWLPFTEDDRALAHDDQSGSFCAGLHAPELARFERENAREHSSGREVIRSRRAVVRHRAAQFKTAGEFLWVRAFDARALGKIRRAAGYEVKRFIVAKNAWLTKVTA